MFKNNVFNFEDKKSPKKILGFYIGHVLLSLLIATIIGMIIPSDIVVSNQSTFSEAIKEGFKQGLNDKTSFKAGQLIAIFYCMILSFLILFKKKKLFNFGLILLALSSGLIASILGIFIGLLPSLYFCRLEKNNKSSLENKK